MSWLFDQDPDVACIASTAVVNGAPVMIATHYEDDHSWAFLDGQEVDLDDALVVAMSTVLDLHPELDDVADLPPGWTTSRSSVGAAWVKQRDE
jgi:hypothetical protein